MACPFAKLTEIYTTTEGSVSQCNHQNCYWLDFDGKQTAFRVSDFFAFKHEVDSIDVDAMLADPSPGSDYQILMPHRIQHCFILDALSILALKELLAGAKFMIELNSMIRSFSMYSQQDAVLEA